MDREYTLITGASGFIGSHVAEALAADKRYAPVAIVRNIHNMAEINAIEEKGVVIVHGTFYDEGILEQVFKNYKISNVIHMAAVRGAGHGSRDDYHTVNVRGTETLLKHSLKKKVDKFIYCSSVGVYGTIPDELPATLTTPLKGDNDYHSSKILAEEKVMEFIGKGLNAFIVRPAITYGERDNGFLSTLVRLTQKRMLILPFRQTMVHLLDVASLARLFARMLEPGNPESRIFIVADREPVSMRDLVNTIYISAYGKPYPSFLRLPDLFFEPVTALCRLVRSEKWLVRLLLLSRDWKYDVSVATSELGFRPSDTLERVEALLKGAGQN